MKARSDTETTPAGAPVTIVMLTWNGLAVTQPCLTGLLERTKGIAFEVVVVDNGSTDGTVEWLRGVQGIRLVENRTNEGFVRGNNRALREVPPDRDVVLLNNDMEVLQEDWLRRLHDVAHADPAHGVVGCRLRFPDGRLLHTGTVIPLDTFHGFQVGSNEEEIGQFPGVKEVEGVVGACLYIRADARARVGLLSEDYESYFEDTDYCLRAREAGYKVVSANDVCLVHHMGASTKERPAFLNDLFNRSRATFIRKWGAALAGRYTRKLVLRGTTHGAVGWATAARDLALALDREGVDVAMEDLRGLSQRALSSGDPRIDQCRRWIRPRGPAEVVLGRVEDFQHNEGFRQAGYTAFRRAGFTWEEIDACNRLDEVWVASSANRRSLLENGVEKPIHVIPFGFDPDYFHPGIAARRFTGRFVFLAPSDGTPLSGLDALLKAYAAAFRADDRVLLLVSLMPGPGDASFERQVGEIAAKAAAPVVVLERPVLLQRQMGVLYRSADCLAWPSRGEGFGLPVLEALACGCPAIATPRGGPADYLREGSGWLLRDEAALETLLREVARDPDEVRRRGAAAARDALAWTWGHAARKIVQRLDALREPEELPCR